jgi:multisubunit Na+/H+ antiporter MnhG subunit
MQPNLQAVCPTKRKGDLPGKEEYMNENNLGAVIPVLGVFIPIVAILSVFTFTTFAVWFGTRQREREAFYRAETLRRITETSGEGARAAIELLREEERMKRIKAREGLKTGGVVNLGVGVGLVIFLRAVLGNGGVYLCGLIPFFIGLSLLIYVLFLASPIEPGPKA